jgi:exoribonuclease II
MGEQQKNSQKFANLFASIFEPFWPKMLAKNNCKLLKNIPKSPMCCQFKFKFNVIFEINVTFFKGFSSNNFGTELSGSVGGTIENYSRAFALELWSRAFNL